MEAIPDTIYKEVKAAYEAVLELPDKKPAVQHLLCPIGITGAGKSTVMRPLCKRLSLARIENDAIRKLFKDRGYGYDRVRDLAFELGRECIEMGYSVGIDSDCITKVDELKALAARHGLRLFWIQIKPPEEFILNKLSHLTPNWLGTAEEMVANYYERKPLHAHVDLPLTYTFDTSQPNLSEQIEQCAKLIEATLT